MLDRDERRALMRAVERNLAAHAAHLHGLVDGANLFRVGDFQVADSGLDHDTFNTVSRADFALGFRDEDVESIAMHIRGARRPFSWWVADDAVLQEALDILQPSGFRVGESEEVMYADLLDPRRASAVPTGIQVLEAQRSSQLDDYAEILAANWNPPAGDVATFLHAAGSHPRWSTAPESRFFVAYSGNQAVAGAEVHVAGGVAGLYGIATLESHRGQGIASALVTTCLDWARSKGIRTAVLQATQDGSGVYRRQGFRTIGKCTEFSM